jgi:hypothetical protein
MGCIFNPPIGREIDSPTAADVCQLILDGSISYWESGN